MYDIHCHVLAEIDDGARSFEDSLQICKIAAQEGIRAIAATPHFIDKQSETEQSKIISALYQLNQAIKNKGIELMLLPGMEVYLTPDLVELYEQGKIITLNYKNHMLIEIPILSKNLPLYLNDVLFRLQLKGVRPVIAHPERCRSVIRNPNIIYDLIENGCIIQLNSGSLEGAFGREVQKTAYDLLKHNMVHIIASDNHSTYDRMSSLKECYDIVSKKFSKTTAKDLFINNPYKVINGENLCIEEPEKIKTNKFGIA